MIATSSPRRPTQAAAERGPRVVGVHPSVTALLGEIARAAPLDTPVLIQGDTGVGKELVAELLHAQSGRAGRLVAVNVAALPEPLAEAELFGVERGAYTGATTRRSGLIEDAAEGTLYLDEAGDLSPAVQAKLLRVFETGLVRRLGGGPWRRIRFRLVMSVQESSETLMASRRWRPDFHYRVAGIELRVPTLAERISDVPLLAEHFLAPLGRGALSEETIVLLLGYPWPGNVRQLRRVLERAAFFAGSAAIGVHHVRHALAAGRSAGAESREDKAVALAVEHPRVTAERGRIEAALKGAGYNMRIAAIVLGCARATLYRRVTALGIALPDRRGRRG